MGPHPVSLAAQPLARLRIQDLTPELTCEAPLLNYITFQNWRLEEQITSNLKPDSRTRPKPWLHANFTFSFFSFFSWRLNPVDVHDLTLSIFNIIGSQEKAIQYFHLGYCLVFFLIHVASTWIRLTCVFRSQLLDRQGFQESVPGSRALSGVNSWIQMVFGFEFSWKTSSKLDDGWPESVEEQVFSC